MKGISHFFPLLLTKTKLLIILGIDEDVKEKLLSYIPFVELQTCRNYL